jgi:hypothetical protein
MNILEVAIWEFVAALAVFCFLVILAQMPFAERGATMFRNESVLRAACGPVVSPIASLVEHALPIPNQLLRVFIGALM